MSKKIDTITTYEDLQDARIKRVKLTSKGRKLAGDILKIMET